MTLPLEELTSLPSSSAVSSNDRTRRLDIAPLPSLDAFRDYPVRVEMAELQSKLEFKAVDSKCAWELLEHQIIG